MKRADLATLRRRIFAELGRQPDGWVPAGIHIHATGDVVSVCVVDDGHNVHHWVGTIEGADPECILIQLAENARDQEENDGG